MNLYLMRHGIALPAGDPSAEADSDRPLSRKGLKRIRKAARGIRRLDIPFDVLLSSPLVRARQTMNLVAAALGAENLVEDFSSLAPESTVEKLISALKPYQDRRHLLLVGHEPLLSNALANLLVGKRNSMNVDFKKGALCGIEIDALPPATPATLRWFLTPKQLRLLGARPAKR